MAAIHFYGGDRGGVGKSTVCSTAIQMHLDKGIPFISIDSDRSNPDVKRIYSQTTKLAVFSEAQRYQDAAIHIYNAALKTRVLVNLPAQVQAPLWEWFTENEILSVAPEDGIQIYHWFVSDASWDSLNILKKYLNFFKDEIGHILVKNHGKTEKWDALERDEEIQSLISAYKVKVIDFPKFHGTRELNLINTRSMTFGEARQAEDFNSISRRRVTRFLRLAFEAIERAGVF